MLKASINQHFMMFVIGKGKCHRKAVSSVFLLLTFLTVVLPVTLIHFVLLPTNCPVHCGVVSVIGINMST